MGVGLNGRAHAVKAYAGPLAGVRVLDLTRVLSGPFSTLILSDLGAEVIKVEEPGKGDSARYSGPKVGGESSHFLTANRGKKSIILDLKSPEGKEIAVDLARVSDVVVENYRPGVLTRLGLDFEQLSQVNPGIIVCSISGFGQMGPLRDRTSFDAIAQGFTGAMAVTGEPGPGGGPVRMGIALGDLSGGVFGAIAILAALHERDKTGRGAALDIGMYDAMVSLMHYYITDFLLTGKEPGRVGSGNPSIFPYGAFEVADGYLMVAAFQTPFWRKLCSVMGLEHLAKDARFATNDLRVHNKVELLPILHPVFMSKTREEWGRLLDEADVPNGPIQTVGEVATHPHTRARDMVAEVEHPTAGRVAITGRPIKFMGRQQTPLHPAPLLGQHTQEVLEQVLGYKSQRIHELAERGAVGLVTTGAEV